MSAKLPPHAAVCLVWSESSSTRTACLACRYRVAGKAGEPDTLGSICNFSILGRGPCSAFTWVLRSHSPSAMQNACSQPVGSCLTNQLKDLKAADDALIARGTTPLRYVTRWGGGNPSARQVNPKP